MSDDDDLYFGETGPTQLEYHVTGVCGVALFCVVLVTALRGAVLTTSHAHLRFFFLAIFLTAALELPRYLIFAIQGTYTSRVAYAMHMLAGLFYFFSLSVVCYMWSCIIDLGTVFSWLYSKPGLVAANVFLGSILVYACAACLTAPSLSHFFHSDLFILFVAQEIVQSLLYTAGMTLYGVSMILKLKYMQGSALSVLQRLLVRITVTLGFTSLATLLRLVMCCLQIASSKANFNVSNSFFTHYGILWFSLAEFIPRGGSSLALLLFMSKRSHQVSRREIRQRYAGSDFGVGTVLSSAKDLSSSMEHSSLSSINGHLLAHERDSMQCSLKNSGGDPLTEDLLSTYSQSQSQSYSYGFSNSRGNSQSNSFVGRVQSPSSDSSDSSAE